MKPALAVFNDLALEVGGLPSDPRFAAVLVLFGRVETEPLMLRALAEAAAPPQITEWVRGLSRAHPWWAFGHAVALWTALDLVGSESLSTAATMLTWNPEAAALRSQVYTVGSTGGWAATGWTYPPTSVGDGALRAHSYIPLSPARDWYRPDVVKALVGRYPTPDDVGF